MAKSKTSKTHPMVYVLAAIGVIALILVVVFVLGSASSHNYYTTTTTPATTSLQIVSQTYTLYTSGYVFSVSPGNWYYENFTVPTDAISVYNIMGSYTSQGAIEVAIMTPTQYGAFTQNHGAISSGNYYYGDTQGSTIDSSLSPGQYVIVFYDPGIFTTDTVTVVNPIHFNYTVYG